MKFQPGQSGNPGGRPKAVHSVVDLARQHTEEAVTTLVEVMRDETAPATARTAAAGHLLDRGWGRPTQPVDMSKNQLERLSDDELTFLMETLEKAAEAQQLDERASEGGLH